MKEANKAPEEEVAIHVKVPSSLRRTLRIIAAETDTNIKDLVALMLTEGVASRQDG